MADDYSIYKPKPRKTKAPKPGGDSGKGDSGKGSGGSGGGGGGGGYDYAKEQKKAQRKASNRFIEQANSTSGQIKAIRSQLDGGFRKALATRLSNIKLVYGQQDSALVEAYNTQIGGLRTAAEANEKATSDQTIAALSNRARERTMALTEAMNQGAGESDTLKSQLMSLRSWEANQSEVSRSYFDSLNSINNEITGLTASTKVNRQNLQNEVNQDSVDVRDAYFDQRSQAWVQLGNLYGEKGMNLGMANEQLSSKSTSSARKKAVKQSDRAFMAAAKNNSRAAKNPGISAGLRNWKGAAPVDARVNNGGIETVATATTIKRPEGATLRKW